MFKSRIEAGKLLAEKIKEELLINRRLKSAIPEKLKKKWVILGIPRGGVLIANEVAKTLNCPMDVIVTKKLGAPGQKELAIGAVGETSGAEYIDSKLIKELNVGSRYLKEEIEQKKQEIKRREKLYRRGKPALDLKNKIVIIVDDGAATGATMIAACREGWNNQPKKVIVGLPVIAKDTLEKLEKEADKVIYLLAPELFYAVGQFYQNFPQVGDETVRKILLP